MPKSKTQKRLEVLEKLETQLREDVRNTEVSIYQIKVPYRQVMLLTQINNLRAKLNYSPYKIGEDE